MIKNGKAIGNDRVTLNIIKTKGQFVIAFVCKLCGMSFESGAVAEIPKTAGIIILYKGKGDRNECNNYRGISLLSVVRKIYAEALFAAEGLRG